MTAIISKLALLYNRNIKIKWIRHLLEKGFIYYKRMLCFISYGTTDFFNTIVIETSSRCNRKCSYCPVADHDRGDHLLPEPLFKKIIAELVELKYRGEIYHHHFGEPLLDDRLEDLVRYEHACLPKAKIIIFSNGDFLDLERAKRLFDAGVMYFLITLHERKKGSKFNAFYESLDHDLKKKIYIRLLTNDSLLCTRGGLVAVKNKEVKEFCIYPTNTFVIDAHGSAILCCEDFFSNYSFGNLETDTIMSIWQQPRLKKLRKQLFAGKFSLPICTHCQK